MHVIHKILTVAFLSIEPTKVPMRFRQIKSTGILSPLPRSRLKSTGWLAGGRLLIRKLGNPQTDSSGSHSDFLPAIELVSAVQVAEVLQLLDRPN